ncbi:hypothetical protein JBO49_27280 [Serratia fonticola]|uniref:ECs1072 family phage-associated protein n=1 Tax=Serratia fonticola TaxID=47917 RepID=UPI00192B1823|nr:hypothetical protein [Serratia fonticola]
MTSEIDAGFYPCPAHGLVVMLFRLGLSTLERTQAERLPTTKGVSKMDISITHYYNLFDYTLRNILKTHNLNIDAHDYDEHEHFFCMRALCIFKLDKLLFDYKQKHDHLRMVLSGKSALVSYLANEKGMPFNDSKNISLNDALIVLWEDIKAVEIPNEVIYYLTTNGGVRLGDYEPRFYMARYTEYLDSEWDPDAWDRRLLK